MVKLGKQRMPEKHVQYGYAWLNQRAVLHAEEPISEQVTFGLSGRHEVTVASRTPDGTQMAHTWSPRKLSLSSSPSCTFISPSRTTCLPSRCPARPPCASRPSCLARRSAATCSRVADVASAALRRVLTESTDACNRLRRVRSKRARF